MLRSIFRGDRKETKSRRNFNTSDSRKTNLNLPLCSYLAGVLTHQSLSKQSIDDNSSATSLSHAVENMKYLDGRHELFLTLSDKLFNSSDDNGPIKRSMAQNIAGSGLSYDDLCKLYSTFGSGRVVAILSNPPSASSSKTPRVTRTKRILVAIVRHFDEKNHEE